MSEHNDLKKLNVGCGSRPLKGFVNLDRMAGEGVDVVCDLEKCLQQPYFDTNGKIINEVYRLPFPDDHFDRILCSHTIEHIRNFLPVMEELWRVAKPNASAIFITPYGGCDIAFEDPTHVRQFFSNSWLYAAQTAYGGADYGYRGDWDCKKIIYRVPKELGVDDKTPVDKLIEAIHQVRNVCTELVAELVAVKPARTRGHGSWQPDRRVEIV